MSEILVFVHIGKFLTNVTHKNFENDEELLNFIDEKLKLPDDDLDFLIAGGTVYARDNLLVYLADGEWSGSTFDFLEED